MVGAAVCPALALPPWSYTGELDWHPYLPNIFSLTSCPVDVLVRQTVQQTVLPPGGYLGELLDPLQRGLRLHAELVRLLLQLVPGRQQRLAEAGRARAAVLAPAAQGRD